MTREEALEIAKKEMLSGSIRNGKLKIKDSDPKEVKIAKVALAITGIYQELEKEVKCKKYRYSRGWQLDSEGALKTWEQAESILNENRPIRYSGETWVLEIADTEWHLAETWYSYIFL